MDGSAERQRVAWCQQPFHSSYIKLKDVGLSNAVSIAPPMEEPQCKPVLRSGRFVLGCKHFAETDIRSKAHGACEFCVGAKLIEQASRSNEAVSFLDIDKLLRNYHAGREEMAETLHQHEANNMETWILRMRTPDTPQN
ncbi:uncharacterized protein [Physcomitrium patens]|uniref:Uncharacterized protein n=2 Tax=Physcomitrium patens TaxID=3218 RepID=A0A2K1IS56_PHYPA|nr:uncharacterized protein LOC112274446 [Physcomitrium patens]PNR32105.1 hypothetical protein PHYPA_026230 [Physcomitrium patens]|eukprot:XP_024359726.1 uncharacterized protein LOC112274446 [Physcomitrella patens]